MMVRRHPVIGAIGGAIIGLGLALLLAILGLAPIGPASVLALVVFFALIGVIYALVMPPPAAPPA